MHALMCVCIYMNAYAPLCLLDAHTANPKSIIKVTLPGTVQPGFGSTRALEL